MTGYGACSWPISYAGCIVEGSDPPAVAQCSAIETLDSQTRFDIEAMASDLLWNWTGRKFGLCPVQLRPCRDPKPMRPSTFLGSGPDARLADGRAGATGRGNWIPYLYEGQWYNAVCGACGPSCGCALDDGVKSLNLHGPVDSITEVWVDGEKLPETAYALMYHKYLVRTDGGRWPLRQDLTKPSTEPGTFEILYAKGTPVPIGGQIAAGRLACELAKAVCQDEECQLPERIQTITRQGVSVGFADGFEGLDEGKVGIWLIDSWVQSMRAPRKIAGVRSPDIASTSRGVQWQLP